MGSDAKAIVEALHEFRDAILVHAAAAKYAEALKNYQANIGKPVTTGGNPHFPQFDTFVTRVAIGRSDHMTVEIPPPRTGYHQAARRRICRPRQGPHNRDARI